MKSNGEIYEISTKKYKILKCPKNDNHKRKVFID